LTKYIVFSPSEDSFSPQTGEIELQLFSRNSGSSKWQKSASQLKVRIDANSADSWRDPEGQSIFLEAAQQSHMRENLMEEISG
jgi:hypothetical protein